jgi:hypothetical protein
VPQLTMAAGKPYLVMQPERRADLEVLSAQLRSAGIDVDLQITEYVPGRRGVGFNQPEAIAFYVLGVVAQTLIANMTEDIFDRAKKWAAARFRRKVAVNPDGLHKPETFTIYGPDDKVLKTWRIDDQGEHEE